MPDLLGWREIKVKRMCGCGSANLLYKCLRANRRKTILSLKPDWLIDTLFQKLEKSSINSKISHKLNN